jgi:hypothetical protein
MYRKWDANRASSRVGVRSARWPIHRIAAFFRFRANIPDGVHALVLQTDRGPEADNSCDWSVWSGVAFEPAGGFGKTRRVPSPRHR